MIPVMIPVMTPVIPVMIPVLTPVIPVMIPVMNSCYGLLLFLLCTPVMTIV